MRRIHRMPFGPEPLPNGGTGFRLWAPAAKAVTLLLGRGEPTVEYGMARLDDGWYRADIAEAGPGSRYRFRIDDDLAVPDPASRFQPEDVHGPSEIVDPLAFAWTDDGWAGRPWEEAVLYELHVGAATLDGTFRAALARLDHLVDLGVTAVELMPVADAPGGRNWGYDGAYLFAPDSRYGGPDDLKALVQAAHERELMVFLDVVYNHFGPEGNYLHRYAPQFFTDRYHTPWGQAMNFDGPESRPVRDFFIHNALYWMEEFHMDGLRLDAVHAIFDASSPDILTELAERVRAEFGDTRDVHLVLENDHNAAHYLERDDAGRPKWFTAQWNDDVHHAFHVLLTSERDGYYADYADAPATHLGRTLTEGFAYQGEPSPYRHNASRGEPSAHLPPTAFVGFLQNHDQVGNRAFGDRITALAPERAVKAAVAVALLAPAPPLLFMGEEWACAQPFLFFCDFEEQLRPAIREGRRREFARFPQFQDEHSRERIPDPNLGETYLQSILNWGDVGREPHRTMLHFYRDLLRLRRREIIPRLAGIQGHAGRFTVRSATALDATWRLGDGAILALVTNLGERQAVLAWQDFGRLLFATDATTPEMLRTGIVPPWSTTWFLHATPTDE